MAVQADAGVLLEHGEDHRDPGGVDAGGRAPRALGGGAGDQCLHLAEQRASAFHRHRDAGAGHRAVAGVEEQAGGVGDRHDALGGEVEAADLVDRAEAVLHRAQHPQPRGALALEVQHDVDEVLEHPWSGDACRPW